MLLTGVGVFAEFTFTARQDKRAREMIGRQLQKAPAPNNMVVKA
jgi:hypothetical protein